jgi:ubiquinone/menaquinone biosynthesis C-methylase UbiE
MKKTLVEKHFDKVAKSYDSGKNKYSFYYTNLKKLLSLLIPKGKRVYEIGCGTGDLLVSLEPKRGFGMDISSEMIKLAKNKYQNDKNIKFSTSWPKDKFDYIFMSDVIEHLENSEEEFKKVAKLMTKNTVFINTMANPVWEPLLMFWERAGWKMKEGKHKRISFDEVKNLFNKLGLKIIKHDHKLLMPIKIPLVTELVNGKLEKYFKKYAFIEYFEAKK